MRRASEPRKFRLSELLKDFPEERYIPFDKLGYKLRSRPRYWLYVYFRFHRKEDGKIVSGLRPFSNGRQAYRFISRYFGQNLIDDIYFVDSKDRKSYDVICDYNNIRFIERSLPFEYD